MRPLPILRTRLLWIAVAALVPVLLGSAILSAQLLDRQEASQIESVLARNRTLISAIDAHMGGHLGRLQVLAASPLLSTGDLKAFGLYAQRVRDVEPDWRNVILAEPDGTQRLNLRFPIGTSLPHEDAQSVAEMQRILATGRGGIGDLGFGPHTRLPGLPVRLPVDVAGHPMVLMAIVDPQSLGAVLVAQHYPSTWALTLADSHGRIIARQPRRAVGDLVSERLHHQMSAASSGLYEGHTLEGLDSRSAFVVSPQSGWVVAAAIPIQEARSPRRQAALVISGGFALSLILALGLARWLAARVTRPVTRLAEQARDLAQGRIVAATATGCETGVEEVRQLAEALATASTAVMQRESLLRREQELLRREQEALRAADQAKDEFIAMMGHELRNPLSAISASSQLLQRSEIGRAAAAANGVIARQVLHMTRLVEELLDVSRLALRQFSLRRELLDLTSLVDATVQTWALASTGRAQRLRASLMPAWVNGDAVRLEQVLVNLLDNAEKFSGARGEIAVTLKVLEGHALLDVTDEGSGIAVEELTRIFEPFVQGKQGVDRAHGGLGLGLALVQRIVTLHEGRVRAHSAGPGLGATFEVRLPLATPAQQAALPESAADAAALRPRRVLVVEDNEDARTMLAALLECEGHEVLAAPDGRSALASVPAFKPAVAFVDIGLPDIDGYGVARQLRDSLGDSVRLVALTGYGQPEDRRRAMEAGFDLHFVKPVSRGILLTAFAS